MKIKELENKIIKNNEEIKNKLNISILENEYSSQLNIKQNDEEKYINEIN